MEYCRVAAGGTAPGSQTASSGIKPIQQLEEKKEKKHIRSDSSMSFQGLELLWVVPTSSTHILGETRQASQSFGTLTTSAAAHETTHLACHSA